MMGEHLPGVFPEGVFGDELKGLAVADFTPAHVMV
jgi:hypothetical protein